MQSDTPVGIIGLGLMGTAFSERLIGAGMQVIGFDIDPASREKFRDNRGITAASAGELALRSRAVLVAVYDGAQAQALFGDLESGPARPTIICTTTCAPDEIVRLAGRAANAGFPFIEAPISG